LEAETEAHSDAEAARTEEAAERAVAESRRIEAEDARKDAVANLQKARDAVDQMLTRVGEERLANVPQMEPVRKALLEDAVKFYQGFLQQKSSDPSVRLGTGHAWRRLGGIYASLGHTDKARKASQESIALFEKLVAQFPSEPSYRTALAGSYADLAFLLSWTIGDHRTAEGVFGQAMALEEALATEFPEHRFGVGNLAMGLGTTLQNMGRLDEAEKVLRRAVAVLAEVAAEDPGCRSQQAQSYFRLGGLLVARQMPQDAEKAFRQALAIQERMVAENPTDRWHGHLVSDINLQLANVLRDNGRPKEAEKCYRSALAITQKLAADFPNFRWQRAHLTGIQLNLGRLLVQEHRLAEAEQVYRQAMATMEALTAEGLATPYYRHLLSESQNRLATLLKDAGRTKEAEQVYRQAVASLEKLAAAYPEVPDLRRDLAAKHQAVGDLLRDADRQQEAAKAYRQGLNICESLAAAFPDKADYHAQWTQSRLHLINLLKATGQVGEIEKVHRQTIAFYERLAKNRPTTHEELLEQLDAEYRNLLNVVEGADRRRETEKAYQSSMTKVVEPALAQLEKLTEAEPGNWTHRFARGRLLARLGQWDRAAADFDRAAKLQVKNAPRWIQAGWWVVGPYPDDLRAAFPPEKDPDPNRAVATSIDQANGQANELHWQSAHTEKDGRLDLGAMFNAAEFISAYALTRVYSMSDQDVVLLVGSDDEVRVWLNGALVHEYPHRRGAAPKQDYVPVRLKTGWNTVLAKVVNGVGWHALYLDISDDPGDRGRAYGVKGQWDKAEPLLAAAVELRNEAVKSKPADPQVWVARGQANSELDQWDDADADFSKAVELSPNGEKLRREVAAWCRQFADRQRSGRQAKSAERAYGHALSRFEKLVADFPNVPDYRQELGACHFGLAFRLAGMKDRDKDAEAAYRQAIDVYEQLTTAVPTNQDNQGTLADCHNNLGSILARRGESEAAEKALRQAIAIKEKLVAEVPAKPGYRRELARSLDNLGNLLAANKGSNEAEQAFRRAVELLEKLTADFRYGSEFRDGLVLYSYHLAVLLAATGQTQEAEHAYGKLLQLAPKSADAHNNLAWLLATCPDAKFRDASRAVRLAKKAVELAPKEGGHWNTLGVAQYRAGDWKAAVTALDKSMELRKSGDSFDFFFLAMAHRQLADKDKARKLYDQAVQWMDKNKPNDEELRRFRAEAAELLGVKEESGR
jgi:tetratricopeptide (TPR) repeat protein